MEFTGNFFTLLRPYPLALGLLGLSAILQHGATYAAVKTSGDIQTRAKAAAKTAGIVFIAMLLLSLAATIVYIPSSLNSVFIWISAAVVVLSWLAHRRSLARGRNSAAFAASALVFAGLWGIAGATHFPRLVNAINDPAFSITLHNASSSELTLKIMLGIVVVGMPVVLFYTVYVYRVLRGNPR
jgi:cytochrome d ubiquinol oxidase subunit II